MRDCKYRLTTTWSNGMAAGLMKITPTGKTGSLIGIYNSKLENFILLSRHLRYANRCDVSLVTLSAQNNNSIKITGLQPLCFRAWPYSEEAWKWLSMIISFPHRDFINLNIRPEYSWCGAMIHGGQKRWRNIQFPGTNLIPMDLSWSYNGAKKMVFDKHFNFPDYLTTLKL